jgi:hypothetical protein
VKNEKKAKQVVFNDSDNSDFSDGLSKNKDEKKIWSTPSLVKIDSNIAQKIRNSNSIQ